MGLPYAPPCCLIKEEQLAKMFYDKEKMEKNIEKTTIKIQ